MSEEKVFHDGPMNFTNEYTVPEKKDSMLDFNTSYAPSVAIHRGKRPIVASSVTTEDIPHSEVAADWEQRNNKALTSRRAEVSINFDIAQDFDLLGKVVGDLQADVGVSLENILGTLSLVKEYTGFSGDPEEQTGNYIAFKVAYNGDFDNITVQKGDKAEVDYDPTDSTFILIMQEHYPITVRAYKDGVVVASKTYNTSQLVFKKEEGR